MPRQIHKIVQFHGGLNSNSDPRDIAENELSEATDVMVDELGKIRMMGGIAQHYNYTNTANTAANSITIVPGYGLFQFSHDRLEGETAGASAAQTGDDYLVISESGNAEIDIHSRVENTWGTGKIDGSTSGSSTTNFYAVDGALRVGWGTVGDGETQWYGYIKRNYFDSTNRQTLHTWVTQDAEVKEGSIIAAIASSMEFHLNADSSAWGTTIAVSDFSSDWDNLSTRAGDIGIGVETYQTAGLLWESGSARQYYYTFIYDGSQESGIYPLAGGVETTAADSKYRFRVFMNTGENQPNGVTWVKRATGARLYWREVDGNETGPLFQVLEINFTEGVRMDPTQDWQEWTNDGSGITKAAAIEMLEPPRAFTYESNTGINPDELGVPGGTSDLVYSFNTAVVANRMVYVGNIKTMGGEIFGDMMVKSPVNQFDMLLMSRGIEASVRDGDEIIKLEEYADRILQFKKKKMHLINISQEIEYLEDTFIHKGVSHPAATCKTDYGIAWVNKQGCYLYDGQRVNDLLEKQGRQIIKESDWATFAANEPMIGYIPKKRQLLVADDITTNGDGSVYLYDIVTQSWVKGGAGTISDQIKTNFVTDWNGDLIYVHSSSGTVVKWDDAGDSSSNLSIKTKDIDFGNPGQKKTVYKVYISYKGDGSSTTVKYGVNGETDSGDLYAFDSNNLADKSSAENLETWHTAILKPYTASQAKDIYSFQIIFGGTAGATFEINDASIVYRLKGVR